MTNLEKWLMNIITVFSVKMTPVEASLNKNERKVFANLYGDLIYSKHVPAKFHVREKVRISKYKRKFSTRVSLLIGRKKFLLSTRS